MTVEQSQQACRSLTRATAKNFGITFRVLSRDQARDMETLYAFMRRTDDLADRDAPARKRREDLEHWRQSFLSVLNGEFCDDPYLPAVAELVHRRGIEAGYFEAVIDGCIQDTQPVAIATQDELEAYCYRVAGAVGLCCLGVWGYAGRGVEGTQADAREAERLAVTTGFAFQLTNILRDIREDALNERRYLPLEDLTRFRCCPADLQTTTSAPPSGPLLELLKFETARARTAFDESAALVPLVSPQGRKVLTAMRHVYGGLLAEIERRRFDVFSQRVRVSQTRKIAAFLRGWIAR